MEGQALTGGFADASIDAAIGFRAALNAMARPGTIETLKGATPPTPLSTAAGSLILVLCDAETPVFLGESHDNRDVRDWITFHTGAPFTDASTAQFAVGTWDALQPLTAFPVGTPEYPDRSTTLIVEREELGTGGAHLTGPGIKDRASLTLPDIPQIQQNAALFPLGLDFYFTAGDRLAGLPRTTRVEAA